MKYLTISFQDTMSLEHLSLGDRVEVVFGVYHSRGRVIIKVELEECEHNWVSAVNEVVKSGEICTLTEHQLEIVKMMAEGLTNQEIAWKLFCSEKTMKGNNERLFHKMGARNRAHVVTIAFRAGLIS